MAWESRKVEDLRYELLEAYIEGESMTKLCDKYDISRKTAYKWYERYLEEGKEGLKDRTRAPKNPYKFYSDKAIEKAITMKCRYPRWGPKKIRVLLYRAHPEKTWPSVSRLHQVFKANGLVRPRRLRRRVPASHPLGDVTKSNETWMADFKGWQLQKNGEKCEPFTLTDGHTRYLIKCQHLIRKNEEHVWNIYMEAFREYGLPLRVRTDNGPPFGSTGAGRLTKLSVNLIKVGITPEWIEPGHPEENGRHERMHLTLKEEVGVSGSLRQHQRRLKEFQERYNYERPHEALEMSCPGEVYSRSPREWDGRLRSPEYREEMRVRKVGQSGSIWLKGKEYFIGGMIKGEPVGLEEIDNEVYAVKYGPIKLGEITKKGFMRPQRKRKR